MTSPKAKARDYLAGLPDDWYVPDPPPKEPDMQQDISLFDFRSMLEAHLGDRDGVLIAGGGYLRNDPRDESEIFAPDCVVAFGVDARAVVSRNGYVIQHAGKPPDFVLEVASRSTGRRDYTVKRDGYAGYGVREYWRFDYTGGRFHDAPLAGDVLTGEDVHAGLRSTAMRTVCYGATARCWDWTCAGMRVSCDSESPATEPVPVRPCWSCGRNGTRRKSKGQYGPPSDRGSRGTMPQRRENVPTALEAELRRLRGE